MLYARAMTRVWEKIERLKSLPDLSISDFGTRRRHGFLWQDWCVQAMIEGLGPSFLGTSNCLIALRREVEAIGTNAHELPMVYAALADSDEELARAPYRVLADWQEDYEGNLLVILPDTYGTTNFLKHAPDWVAGWTGIRIDSKDPIEGGEEAIDWWLSRGRDPRQKLAIFSDGLDVDTHQRHPPPVPRPHAPRLRLGHAAHQRLPRPCAERRARPDLDRLQGASRPNGRPAVKISDNPTKAIGPKAEIERYKRVFEVGVQTAQPVLV